MLHADHRPGRDEISISVEPAADPPYQSIAAQPERVRKHLRTKAADLLAIQRLLFEMQEPASVVAVSRGDGAFEERLESFARENRKDRRWVQRMLRQLKSLQRARELADATTRRYELKRKRRIEKLSKLLERGKRIPASLRLLEHQLPLPLSHFPKEYVWVGGRRQQRTAVGEGVVWTEMDVHALHLNLLSYSFEQLRESRPGGDLHREIWTWIDRKDPKGIIPFSFDNCCRVAGWDPFFVREAIDDFREFGGSRYIAGGRRNPRMSAFANHIANRSGRSAA